MNRRQTALLTIGSALSADSYQFIAPTPLTYQRVLSRPVKHDADWLVEVFGWNRPFQREDIGERYVTLLEDAGLIAATAAGQLRCLVRFSTLDDLIFAHSGYPTDEPDSVFFGPDTYRFARGLRWVSDTDKEFRPKNVIDIGAGTGAGALYAVRQFPSLDTIILADINDKALEYSQVNAVLNRVTGVTACQSDVLAGVGQAADLIISNPPYLVDQAQRAYRHGGGEWGCDLAVKILEQALEQLTPQGRLILYTGTPIVGGVDMVLAQIRGVLESRTVQYRYEELDPDVFGEELEHPPYIEADRIAAVVLHVRAADLIR